MNAPQALYWYHQQPRTADYRNSSANRTGPYITELDMTGQPGVLKIVKYVPEAELAKMAAALLAKSPPPPIVINNPDVASVVAIAIKTERDAILSEIETGIWFDKTTEEVLAEIAEAIRARGEAQP